MGLQSSINLRFRFVPSDIDTKPSIIIQSIKRIDFHYSPQHNIRN